MNKRAARATWFVIWSIIIVGCVPNSPTPPSLTPTPATPELIGLADFHTHQFGHLGFGGTILSHSPDPNTPCLPPLPYDETTLRIKDLVRNGLFSEAAFLAKSGKCYPTVNNLTSQRMDTDNLRRAWTYGLRLIVVHAVSNEFLCKVAELADPCPSDREAIEAQIQAARDLEAQIDSASGGPGKGWYRIVESPAQARQVIGQGKLAVVLGVEASNAFGGCRFEPSGNVDAINGGAKETTWRLTCGYRQAALDSLQTQEALALFEHYWDLGVRHFFPIHNMDGTAGGAALFSSTLHGVINPSHLNSAALGNVVSDIDNLLLAARPPVQSWNCSSRFTFDGGRCNVLGLTETGRYLITLMASYGGVLDIDHISWRAKRELLEDGGLLGGVYPFVSSHSGIQQINHGDQNNEAQLAPEDFAAMIRAGGAFAPILPPVGRTVEEDTFPMTGPATPTPVAPHACGGTTESWVQAYRYVLNKLKNENRKLFSGQPPYLGIGFGTDFSAPVPVAAYPRFEGDQHISATTTGSPLTVYAGFFTPHPRMEKDAPCYKVPGTSAEGAAQPHVSYPFPAHLAPTVLLDKSTTPWGGDATPYDISFRGVVHIGMIPDFVEELRALGLTDQDLEPLWHGAEAYVRAWEASQAWKGYFAAEDNNGIADTCRSMRKEILKYNLSESFTEVAPLLERLKRKGCHGFAKAGPTPGVGWLYLSDNGLGQPQDKIEAPTIPAGTSTKFAFFLRNRGHLPVTVSGLRIEGDPTGALQPDMTSPIVVGVGQIEGFALKYNPSVQGPFHATVVVLSDELGLPELPLPVVGEVRPPLPRGRVQLSARELDFGVVRRGSSNSLAVVIENTGSLDISMVDANVSLEQPPAQFSVPAVLPQQIPPGGRTDYFITYVPTVDGSADGQAVLRFTLGDGAEVTESIKLHGVAGTPKLLLTPAVLDFGALAPGVSKQLTAGIVNTGNMPLTVSASYWLAGSAAYATSGLQVPLVIGVGQTVSFIVTFTAPPFAGQPVNGTIEFTSDDPDAPSARLELLGSASGVRLRITDFISFRQPQLNQAATVEITNAGSTPAIITQLGFTDGTLFEFENPPQLPLTVDAGQKTNLTVRVKQIPPPGVYFDYIVVKSNDPLRPTINVGLELRR